MNLKSLEYFIEVANDLNITSAAQRLYISQQALSAQIQKLEQYYGVTLFERQPKMPKVFMETSRSHCIPVMLEGSSAGKPDCARSDSCAKTVMHSL